MGEEREGISLLLECSIRALGNYAHERTVAIR